MATNQWIMQRDCLTHHCYTSDLTIAGNFSKCINETAKVAVEAASKAGKLNDTSSPGQYWGRCEYIDYKKLKEGLRNGASQKHVGTTKALMSAVGVGLLMIGSGII
ncbi:hypothetical protein ONS95_012184 [Cadophora gregata]|uniref:uncharacterized protein n=1 Tax=Cadophora gregata TaxID=51156 RepID=UPI0026DA91CE|nr:uncharacterized protein ONS95_012184 [Cadophora gregata]KAK0117863.1 hypothetical protein ONS95_012184 [Cadophora gregata]KAK0122918.1 hypothetical protein ONS96_009943 [Cadophora gregata f. sp. sojae]